MQHLMAGSSSGPGVEIHYERWPWPRFHFVTWRGDIFFTASSGERVVNSSEKIFNEKIKKKNVMKETV